MMIISRAMVLQYKGAYFTTKMRVGQIIIREVIRNIVIRLFTHIIIIINVKLFKQVMAAIFLIWIIKYFSPNPRIFSQPLHSLLLLPLSPPQELRSCQVIEDWGYIGQHGGVVEGGSHLLDQVLLYRGQWLGCLGLLLREGWRKSDGLPSLEWLGCAELLVRVKGCPRVKYWLWCLVQYGGGWGGEGGHTVSICLAVMVLASCSGAGLGYVE